MIIIYNKINTKSALDNIGYTLQAQIQTLIHQHSTQIVYTHFHTLVTRLHHQSPTQFTNISILNCSHILFNFVLVQMIEEFFL